MRAATTTGRQFELRAVTNLLHYFMYGMCTALRCSTGVIINMLAICFASVLLCNWPRQLPACGSCCATTKADATSFFGAFPANPRQRTAVIKLATAT